MRLQHGFKCFRNEITIQIENYNIVLYRRDKYYAFHSKTSTTRKSQTFYCRAKQCECVGFGLSISPPRFSWPLFRYNTSTRPVLLSIDFHTKSRYQWNPTQYRGHDSIRYVLSLSTLADLFASHTVIYIYSNRRLLIEIAIRRVLHGKSDRITGGNKLY